MPQRKLVVHSGHAGQPATGHDTGLLESAPRVLVVDDDPGIVLLMREMLASAGFDVADAESGEQAIERAAEFGPDLVLLDINMPGMDGIATCAKLRSQSEMQFPIVMVTSVDDAMSIQSAFDAGATDFILKPINWPILQRRLEALLREWESSAELADTSRRADLLEKIAPELVMVVNRKGEVIEDLSPDAAGDGKVAAGAQSLDQLFGVDVASRFKQRISGVLKTSKHSSLEFELPDHGVVRTCEAKFLVESREHVILVIQDVSAERNAQSEVYELAFFDPLTALPNRNLFERYARDLLVDAGLHDGLVAVVCLTLDGLAVSDAQQDQTLKDVAHRIAKSLAGCEQAVRLGDGPAARRVSRLDESRFAVLLKNVQGKDEVKSVCNRIVSAFEHDAPNAGVAMFPMDGRDLTTILHAADAAMQEARTSGKTVCFSSRAGDLKLVETADYGSELRQALEAGQLELYLQPRSPVSGRTVTCAEALLRWNHPMRGFVPLDEILQLAKATGLILPLGDWVLESACKAALDWAGAPPPRVSVNLSQQEFARKDLADRVIEALDRSGLDADRLELELTEAALMRTENVVEDLERLKTLGIGLILDDFGVGHSSLTQLKDYPIDALKIDRSFVQGLPDSGDDAAICEVIITLAHKLGMKVIAEGVESEEQLRFLRNLSCDEFQGFYICRPLPPADFDLYLSEQIGAY